MSRTVERRRRTTDQPKKTKSNWDLIGPSASAVERLWTQEIDLPERPEGEGVPGLPDDPTSLDDSELMSLFVRLNRWVEYMGVCLAAAEVDEKFCEGTLRHLESVAAVQNVGAKNVTLAKAMAHEDETYIEAKDALTHAYAYRKLMQSAYAGVDSKATLLSRELTRRVAREPRDNRTGKWSA